MTAGFRLLGDLEVRTGDQFVDAAGTRRVRRGRARTPVRGYVLSVPAEVVDVYRFRGEAAREDVLRRALALWRASRSPCRRSRTAAPRSARWRTGRSGYAHVELRDTAARTRLAAALELAADTVTRANIHHVLARVHDLGGDQAAAMRHGRLALDLHREGGNEIGVARAGGALAWLAAHQGGHPEAKQLCADATAAERTRAHLVRLPGIQSIGRVPTNGADPEADRG